MLLKPVVYALAPSACLRCGAEGAEVCGGCMNQVLMAKTPTCFRCNALSEQFATCRRCRRHTSLSRVWVAGYYDGVVVELITRLKYHYAIDNGRIGGELIGSIIDGVWDMVVPVPASPKRLRWRGFNPASIVARSLARERGMTYSDVLGRIGNSRQVGASRLQRLEQLQGAFYVRNPGRVAGKKVLLVDDVITTGATLQECAEVLSAGGVASVEAAVLAKH